MKEFLLALALPIIATPALADDVEMLVREYMTNEVAPWASDPVIIAAIRAQNAAHAGISEDEIGELDQAWQDQVGKADAPEIAAVLDNPAAALLREHRAAAGGLITEVFVMDANGLNVAASDVTSDYWQGDEAKFQQTFLAGPDAVHVSEVELDESSQTYQSQGSMTLVDPESGAPIGAITVGVDVESLM